MNDFFVDRIGNVTIGNGVARLDFLRLETVDAEKKQLGYRPSLRLVLPVVGLMQTVQMLDQLRDQIVKQAQAQEKQAADAAGIPPA